MSKNKKISKLKLVKKIDKEKQYVDDPKQFPKEDLTELEKLENDIIGLLSSYLDKGLVSPFEIQTTLLNIVSYNNISVWINAVHDHDCTGDHKTNCQHAITWEILGVLHDMMVQDFKRYNDLESGKGDEELN